MTGQLLSRLRRLPRATEGAALVEFAIVAPTLMLILVGTLDVGHTLYVKAVLQGVVQKAARDSSLQAGASAAAANALDATVKARVKVLDAQITDSDITITRRYYRDYTAAAAHQFEPFGDKNGNHRCDASEPLNDTNSNGKWDPGETYTDTNSNGKWDPGETYTDSNGNGVWDADGADSGQGGAQDKAVYTVAIQYPRLLPLDKFISVPSTISLSATTVLANQPYAEQGVYATPVSRICP